MSRTELFFWKIKLFLRFYTSKKSENGKSGLLSLVKVILEGIVSSKTHDSKLQTAVHNAGTSIIDIMKSKRERWMSKKEETELFKDWDNIYRQIRKEKLLKGIVEVSPEDTTELHKVSVINLVAKDHKTTRTISTVFSDDGKGLEEEALDIVSKAN